MSKFPFDIVLFDLDGTLVDSSLDLAPAINHALTMEGRPHVDPVELRSMIGGGAVRMLKNALLASGGMVERDRFDVLKNALLGHYWAHIADNTVPFPGCVTALEALSKLGCTLAVCTNKTEGPARQLLDALDMAKHFSTVYGSDTLGRDRAKPHPDMLLAAAKDCGGGRVAMVGDSTYDTSAARGAGVPVVAVSFGFNDIPAKDLDCDALIDHFDELVPALQTIGSKLASVAV